MTALRLQCIGNGAQSAGASSALQPTPMTFMHATYAGMWCLRRCQQCGRFHSIDAFDGSNRTCRKRLTMVGREHWQPSSAHIISACIPAHLPACLRSYAAHLQRGMQPSTEPCMDHFSSCQTGTCCQCPRASTSGPHQVPAGLSPPLTHRPAAKRAAQCQEQGPGRGAAAASEGRRGRGGRGCGHGLCKRTLPE